MSVGVSGRSSVGTCRAEWRSGTIPVQPFPVDEARWKLVYAYEDAIGLQVLLFPKARSGLRPAVFDMELAPMGRRYLVSSWAPTGMAGGGTPSGPSSAGVGGTRDLAATLDGPARLDQRWLRAPFVLFGLVPLLLIGYFVRGWLRGRRAAAAYASGRELPPLLLSSFRWSGISRPFSASPATGSYSRHTREHTKLLDEALGLAGTTDDK